MCKMTDKVRDVFNHDNLQVNNMQQRIEVYWLRSPDGKVWVPYGGGPLYNDSAKQSAKWLRDHIEEFRDLLPKAIRGFSVVLGELDTRTFPGKFHAV